MRYRITLRRTEAPTTLPFSYKAQLSAWILQALRQANPAYADFISGSGPSAEDGVGMAFRLFTFTSLEAAQSRVLPGGQGIEMLSDEASFELSFLSEEASVYFARGVAACPLVRIMQAAGASVLRVVKLEGLPMPAFQSRELYRTVSPVSLTVSQWQNGRLRTTSLSPTDANYCPALIQNLLRKYHTLTGRQLPAKDIRFQCLSAPIKHQVAEASETLTDAVRPSYQYDFVLTAPPELQRLVWLAGLGEKTAQGFGTLRILPEAFGQMQQALEAMRQPEPVPAAPTREATTTKVIERSLVAELALAA